MLVSFAAFQIIPNDGKLEREANSAGVTATESFIFDGVLTITNCRNSADVQQVRRVGITTARIFQQIRCVEIDFETVKDYSVTRDTHLLFATVLLAGCAANEPAPVGTVAADNPAIWRNQNNPADSVIVATDKKAGLYVYGLDGKIRSFTEAGRVNKVDLVETGGRLIAAASDRNNVAQSRVALFY